MVHNEIEKDARWIRKYIKKTEPSLARELAQKHYFGLIRLILEKNLNELRRFLKKYAVGELEVIEGAVCIIY